MQDGAEIYESPITTNQGLRYKIQLSFDRGVWMQRHIWYPCENPLYPFLNYYREDEWIRAAISPGVRNPGYKKVSP